jgi:hypothetical protein
MDVWVAVRLYVCVCVCVCIYVYIFMYIDIYIYISVCVCLCELYMCTHMHMRLHACCNRHAGISHAPFLHVRLWSGLAWGWQYHDFISKTQDFC